MYRYIILAWNPRDPRGVATAAHLAGQLRTASWTWTGVLKGAGVAVLQAGVRPGVSEAQVLAGGRGAVLGTLFNRLDCTGADSENRASLDEKASAAIAASGGGYLLEHYWGRYVAVVHEESSGTTWILRDPTGALPCLFTTHRGVHVVFSDIADCTQLGLPPFSINWDYIAALVPYSALQVRETGLNEVSELQPGERLEIHGSAVRRALLWNPVHIARSDVVEDPDVAAKMFRTTTRACVRAWAARYEGILHRLSGGLDSSIVLGCLDSASSATPVTCLNYFGTGPFEDERRYARLAAQRANRRMIERAHDSGSVRLNTLLDVAPSHRPFLYLYSVERGRLEADIAQREGATALFSGAGGDGLFYQNRAMLAGADFVHHHGLHLGLMRVAADAAHVDRIALWPVLREAIVAGLLRRKWSALEEVGRYRTLINPEVVGCVKRGDRFVHPWLAEVQGAPHGKLWHILSIAMPLPFYDSLGRPDDPEGVQPLLSQPLIELCLRIPTYTLISGGWDRAIARRAFAADVPREIIRRRAKGASTSSVRQIFDANIGFLRELLLDGLLVKQRLLDKGKLEDALTAGGSPAGTAFLEIVMEHVCTEAWLRIWPTSVPAASAA